MSLLKHKIKFDYEDYLQMPIYDKRYELINGEFYMLPSPSWYHQITSMNIFLALHDYVKTRGLGEVCYAPLDVVLSKKDVVQPDLLFISKERSHIITSKNIRGAPDLVVEILSKSTAKRDKRIKRKLYAKYGVKEYWIVDRDKEEIEVMVLGEKSLVKVGTYHDSQIKSPLFKDLVLNPKDVF